MDLIEIAKNCQRASFEYAELSVAKKNQVLQAMATLLDENRELIYSVNTEEVNKAKERGLNEALVDRLTLTKARFDEMVNGVRHVATLDDPVGEILEGRVLPSGLKLLKKRVPLGVVGVIYESRPNVTVDIAALCLKSGNGCILRGGSEALATNRLLHQILQKALLSVGLNPHGVSFIDSTDREIVGKLLTLDDYVDVIIPRGGEALQRRCKAQATIPVITGGFGISHIFADFNCDLDRAVSVIVNAKVQKPSACNALDTLLIHKDIVDELLAKLVVALKPYKVCLVAHQDLKDKLLNLGYENVVLGTDTDFDTEFLSLKMNISTVDGIASACEHLRKHKASHSDAILTDSKSHANRFIAAAGSACVYVNASTRFTDGGQFGLGAEVAISTQKLHARGPMALRELTSIQYVGEGDYLVRA